MAPFGTPLWRYRKRIVVLCGDIFLAALSYTLAFLIRFEMGIPPPYLSTMWNTLPWIVILRSVTFWYFGLYRGLWRFASIEDLLSIVKATSASSVFILLYFYLIHHMSGYPRSVFFIDWLILTLLLGGSRFSLRLLREVKHLNDRGGKRVLIVGAGEAGENILREMIRNSDLDFNPVGLVDDDPAKRGSKIHGIRILGNRTDIPMLVTRHRIDEIIISIPSATGSQMRSIIEECSKTKARFKTVPSLPEIINGEASLSQIRDVYVEDMLGREPVQIQTGRIQEAIAEKRVLVTGAGGSIGRELCRQIAGFAPEHLLLFERAENSLFYVDKELRESFPGIHITPILADVANQKQTVEVFRQCRPHIVFHAAAHKHVSLMERTPLEAIRNNVLGTKYAADAAVETGVDKFLLISTDKAVKPINFMGMSKKIAEEYIAGISTLNSVRFLSVRFGNVIGSTGSSFRIFREQIRAGGPITVTDPRATRYFMTIPEAVQLVLQALSLGRGGEIFVFDMGKPINIYELAKTMVLLSGLELMRDVEITFTGLRPGEKLSEELFDPEAEELVSTEHGKINMIRRKGPCNFNSLLEHISKLERCVDCLDSVKLVCHVHETIQESKGSVPLGGWNP